MELQTNISIKRSPAEVWDFFANPENWKDWWGGGLKKVDPAWEKGAKLIWEMGAPSSIIECTLSLQVEIRNLWSITTWFFAPGHGDSTVLIYKEQFIGGASMDANTWRANTSATLAKLKRCVESKPAQKKQSSKTDGSPGSGRVPWWRKFWGED